MSNNTYTFTQSYISYFAKVSPPTVSKFIAANKNKIIEAEDKGDNRKRYDFDNTRIIMTELYSKKFIPEKKTQVFFNFKGGTGKTSVCHQVSVLLSIFGFKVLAIDCDPQGHLSHSLGFNEFGHNLTLFDVVNENQYKLQNIIRPVYPGYDAIPSNLSMTRLESTLNHMPGRERVLAKLIEPLKSVYDFILIDTNPTISTLNRNAIIAADAVNIICETQPYSLEGLKLLIQELNELEKAMDTAINYNIIANKYEAKTATSQEVLGAIRHHYGKYMLDYLIRKCEDFNVSAKKRMPIFFFSNKKSPAVEDIIDVTREIITKSSSSNSKATVSEGQIMHIDEQNSVEEKNAA